MSEPFQTLKMFGFLVLKLTGGFHIARYLTRHGLRILCYHGFSLTDEHEFRPHLFMDLRTFRKRMAFLKEAEFSVLSLAEAVRGLQEGALPPDPVVLTFDDGFHSIFSKALPVLQEHGFPGTVYVTTYYSVKGNPVFRLAVQHMFWKTSRRMLDLSGLGLPVDGPLPIKGRADRRKVTWRIIHHAEGEMSEHDRCALAAELGSRLGVPYEPLWAQKGLSIMSADEIREAAASGFDVQLHTHRHRMPQNPALARREIRENRLILEPLVGRPLQHLCYPTGVWHEELFPILADEGIASATTCDPGLNYRGTHRFALRRFLDGMHISGIEFEAEVCGVAELMRRFRSVLRRALLVLRRS